MFKKNENVDDRSRNGSNAKNPSTGKTKTLIKAVEEAAGKRNHRSGYSLDVLANSLRKHGELSKFVNCSDEREKHQVNQLLGRVVDSLDFNVYLHRKVTTHLKGEFTADQLACIFQAYKGILIEYTGKSDVYAKQELFDYIDYEGKVSYDLGNLEEFKAKIQSINPIEYDAFVNLILEFWGMEGKEIGLLQNFLTSNCRSANESPTDYEVKSASMKIIELTPEWILEKLPHTHSADGAGNVSVYTGDATDANFIELALDSLQIRYEAYDYMDENHDLVFAFDFRIEEIEHNCPPFYLRMRYLNDKNFIKNKTSEDNNYEN